MRWTEGLSRRISEAVEAAPSPGSERVACVRVGFPGTREASSSPSYRPPGGGHRLTKPEAVDAAPGVRRSEAAGARMVPPGAGNDARGDGRRGVGVSQSTAEAGELSPRDPRGGKGAPAGGTGGGKDGQHTEVGSRLHVTTTDKRTASRRGASVRPGACPCWAASSRPVAACATIAGRPVVWALA